MEKQEKIEELQKLAEQGDVEAQKDLASLYLQGGSGF